MIKSLGASHGGCELQVTAEANEHIHHVIEIVEQACVVEQRQESC